MTTITASPGELLTADGTPLKVSLRKSLRKTKIRACALVAVPFLFLVVVFIVPIGDLLLRSVDDKLINNLLPRTFAMYETWDQKTLPGEDMFEAVFLDLTTAAKLDLGRGSTRMNYDKSGWRSLIKKSGRKFKKLEGPPYKDAMIEIDKRWSDVRFWQSLGAMKDPYTLGYYLNSVDLRYDANKSVIEQPEPRHLG